MTAVGLHCRQLLRWQREVQETIMQDNPEGSMDLLKLGLRAVETAPEIGADVRRQLRQQLENALRTVRAAAP